MASFLRNEAETLAEVARILRGQSSAPTWKNAPIGFDMEAAFDDSTRRRIGKECSAICCIGGTAWLLENPHTDPNEAHAYVIGVEREGAGRGLYALYFAVTADNQELYYQRDFTRDQAARAIDNYLATGNPDWDSVLASSDNEGAI